MKTELTAERLGQFPSILSSSGEIPRHQLGWRMAVLPFRSLGSPGGYSIAFGMAEELSAAISRFRSPRLIAPVTFWDGIGPAADVLARSRLYQLDYMLDGTISCSDDTVSINIVLLDVVLDFEVIWTKAFETPLDGLHTLQMQIAAELVRQIDPDLSNRGPAFDLPVQTSSAAAHHAVLTAIGGIYRLDQPSFMRARAVLERAIGIDPNYAAAHSWLAYWSLMAVGLGWVENPANVADLAATSADRAVHLQPLDARAMSVAGHVKAYFKHDVRAALTLHAAAIDLNPNLPIAWTMSSWSRIYNGEHATAMRHATMAMSLSPRDPHLFLAEHALMTASFFGRDLEQAETLATMVLTRHPGHVSAVNIHLSILGHMGRHADAAASLALLQVNDPQITIQKIASRITLQPADCDYYVAGLRQAGVPE